MSRSFTAEVQPATQTPIGSVHFMPQQVLKLPNTGKGFIRRETQQSIAAIPEGDFLLIPGQFSTVATSGATAHFNINPEKAQTREESRNKVQFGQLIVHDPDNRERVEYVAMKPLDTPNRAAREFGAISTINALASKGRLSPALQPLGFYRSPDDGRFSLLTKYEHGILTLDNLFWDPDYEPTERQIRAGLGHCALSLAELHSNGIAHADAQVKNIAADNQGVRYVDLEGAQELAMASGRLDPFGARRLMEIDVRTCLESLDGYGVELIAESFTPIYHELITQDGSVVPPEAVLEVREIAEMTW